MDNMVDIHHTGDFYHQHQPHHQQHPEQSQTFQPALFKYHHQDHTGSWLDSGAPSAFYHPDDIDFDIDFLKSSSSSPSSTHSVLSHPSSLETSPLSAFDTFPTPILSEASLFPVSTEQSDQPTASCPEPMFGNSDMMQAETWRSNGQLTPRSGCAAAAPFNTHHQRDSSRSSMGSNGPLSPFAQNITNPHIAVSDATGESFHAFSDPNMANYHLAAKPYPSTTQQHDYYSNFPTSDASQHGLPSYSYAGAPVPRQRKDQLPGGLLTTQGLDRPVRSHPVSVASSMASSTGSPATPSTVGEPGEAERKRNTTSGELKADLDLLLSYFSGASHSPFDEAAPLAPAIPKLERTMTDPYSDELYDAGFINTSAATTQPPSQPVTLPSTTNDVFHQRLQAANSAHLSAVNSPISAGTPHDRSPFHHDSPLAPLPMSGYPPSTLDQPAVRFPSAQQVREHNKAIADAEAMQHAMQQIVRGADTSEPQTISPKDALLAFNETPGEPANFPLFPPSQPQPQQQPQQRTFTGGYGADLGKAAASQGGQMFHGLPMGNRSFHNFLGQSTMPARTQQAQQQPQQQSQQQQQFSFVGRPQTSVPLMGSRPTESTVQRPIDVSADGGTYTCTYHGCTLRFDTPADLQKHKREGHRQAHGLGGARRADLAAAGATGPIIGSQAGPHKCYRINPSTGKPCNTIFSRPYDLTRHEDTIHNARKKKVRCDLCTDEKTFSRADALTRHYRVCHPDHEVPGKHRKRGAAQHHHSST